MNTDDFSTEWQSFDHSQQLRLNSEMLVSEMRNNFRSWESMLFRRDLIEIGTALLVTIVFLLIVVFQNDWVFVVPALSCSGVGLFLYWNRRVQANRSPQTDGTLRSFLLASMDQVQHQIWLLKNVLWWYLLPLGVGVAAVLTSALWKVRGRGIEATLFAIGVATFTGLVFVGVYWLNQRAVARDLEPRRRELASMLSRLEQ